MIYDLQNIRKKCPPSPPSPHHREYTYYFLFLWKNRERTFAVRQKLNRLLITEILKNFARSALQNKCIMIIWTSSVFCIP